MAGPVPVGTSCCLLGAHTPAQACAHCTLCFMCAHAAKGRRRRGSPRLRGRHRQRGRRASAAAYQAKAFGTAAASFAAVCLRSWVKFGLLALTGLPLVCSQVFMCVCVTPGVGIRGWGTAVRGCPRQAADRRGAGPAAHGGAVPRLAGVGVTPRPLPRPPPLLPPPSAHPFDCSARQEGWCMPAASQPKKNRLRKTDHTR
jgi:hypothetical protein